MPDAPAVGLELRFAGPERADAAALPRQRVARSDQPRHQVLELRELDLQLAFARARAAREDVENELRAIDDLAIERPFEVAQLRGRQLVVEDDGVDARLAATAAASIATLPLPRNVAGSGFGPLLLHAQHGVGAGRRREAGQLVERCSGSKWRGESLKRPTSAARSRPLFRVVCVFRGITEAILARAPTALRPA